MSSHDALLCKTPKFEFESLAYYREEKEGNLTIRSKIHPNSIELILNETSKDIMNLCNGERDIKTITKEMMEMYMGASENLILGDIVKFLKEFSKMRLVTWKNGNPFFHDNKLQLDEGYTVSICSFEDAQKIYKFINRSSVKNQDKQPADLVYINPFTIEAGFSINNIYRNLMDDIKKYIAIEKDGVLEGIACINISRMTAVCDFLYIIINSENKYIGDFISYIIQTAPLISSNTVAGCRLYENTDSLIESEYMYVFKELGFYHSGILRDEIGYGVHLNQYDLVFESGEKHNNE